MLCELGQAARLTLLQIETHEDSHLNYTTKSTITADDNNDDNDYADCCSCSCCSWLLLLLLLLLPLLLLLLLLLTVMLMSSLQLLKGLPCEQHAETS